MFIGKAKYRGVNHAIPESATYYFEPNIVQSKATGSSQ